MKRILTIVCILFATVISLQAQSLLGKWKGSTEIDEDGDTITTYYIFKLNNKVEMKMLLNSKDDEIGIITMSFTMPGTFSRNGQTLNIQFEANKSKCKLENVVFTAQMEKEFEEMPEMKKMILEMIKKSIDNEMAKQFANESLFDGEVAIVQLSATKLVLSDGDDTLSFTRFR